MKLTPEMLAKKRAVYYRNREKILAQHKIAHQIHKERDNTRMRAYRLKYVAQDPDWERRYYRMKRDKLFAQFYSIFGHQCVCCGITEKRFLTIDHINNDGKLHRQKHGSSRIRLLQVMKKEGWPKDRYQLLCMNCNWGRQINKGTCPHVEKTVLLFLGKKEVPAGNTY